MIYLDNNSTTPMDPLILKGIYSLFHDSYGNPSSTHSYGQEAKKRLLKETAEIGAFFGVKREEVIFTSGATEGLNLVMRGLFSHSSKASQHLLTSSLEHEAVFQTAKVLEKEGVEVTYLAPLKGEGAITAAAVLAAIRPDTRLIALMWANNETGALTSIEEIAEIALKRQIPLLVDGVALVGKDPFVLPLGVSAFCFSGHKIHTQKGIGVTILRKSLSLTPLITGGPQQLGKRGGTENLPGIAAIAMALQGLKADGEHYIAKIRYLRDLFEGKLLSALEGVKIHAPRKRVSNTSNLFFAGVNGESLLIALDREGVAASHGAACSSGALEPSRVLQMMGCSREEAAGSVRFSLSRMTTEEEIHEACRIVIHTVNHLRSLIK